MSAALEIVPANHSDQRILLIAQEQFSTEGKKAGVRQAVILQDDSLLDLRKNPIQALGHAPAAAKIFLSETQSQIARPIHILDNLPNLFASTVVLRTICPGTICHNQ
jgi:hypothetical protein